MDYIEVENIMNHGAMPNNDSATAIIANNDAIAESIMDIVARGGG